MCVPYAENVNCKLTEVPGLIILLFSLVLAGLINQTVNNFLFGKVINTSFCTGSLNTAFNFMLFPTSNFHGIGGSILTLS